MIKNKNFKVSTTTDNFKIVMLIQMSMIRGKSVHSPLLSYNNFNGNIKIDRLYIQHDYKFETKLMFWQYIRFSVKFILIHFYFSK